MYIYKYIIFKTISVFQRQVLRVFLFIFFFSKPNLRRTDDISKTYNKQIETEETGLMSFKKDNRHMDIICGNDKLNLRLQQKAHKEDFREKEIFLFFKYSFRISKAMFLCVGSVLLSLVKQRLLCC